jgi:hypothetical protein
MKSRSRSQRLCAKAFFRFSEALSSRIQAFVEKVDAALDPFWSKVAFLGRWKVSLTATIAVVLAVIAVRYYYSFVTGFLVPDEAWYYDTFILDKSPIGSYRPAFIAIFILFFSGVTDVWTFLLRGALYSAIWAVASVALFFMIFRRLRVPENMSSLLILSLPLFPVFIVFVPTVLTETPGLFITLVGIYFSLRYVQQGQMINSLLSVLFFFLAYEVREPYLLFVVGSILLFLVLSIKRKSLRGVVVYAVLASLVFPVPVRLDPLTFAQPIYTWAMNVMSGRYQVPTLEPSFVIPIRTTPDLLVALAVGLAYGFNPLFALFAVCSLVTVTFDLLRRRSSTALFLLLNAVCSFGAFAVAAGIMFQGLPGALANWTSAIIRPTYTSLPCLAGVPSLYRRLKIKMVAVLIIVFLILGSTQADLVAKAFQRGLSVEPVDRLSLDYRAPYYRIYLLARGSGKTLVFGGIEMRGIRMYMNMLPNVVLVPVGLRGSHGALNETQFRAWLKEGWDTILLYDDWFTIKVPSMIDDYPEFYSQILRSRQYPGYVVETLWIDGESYALRMVKISNSSLGSLP